MRMVVWVMVGFMLGMGPTAWADYEEPSQEQLQRELREELSEEMDADDWFGTSMTLGLLGEAAMPVLLEAARDPNPVLRANAISALGTMTDDEGGLLEEARAAIEEMMDDPDPHVREEAAVSLKALEEKTEVSGGWDSEDYGS